MAQKPTAIIMASVLQPHHLNPTSMLSICSSHAEHASIRNAPMMSKKTTCTSTASTAPATSTISNYQKPSGLMQPEAPFSPNSRGLTKGTQRSKGPQMSKGWEGNFVAPGCTEPMAAWKIWRGGLECLEPKITKAGKKKKTTPTCLSQRIGSRMLQVFQPFRPCQRIGSWRSTPELRD